MARRQVGSHDEKLVTASAGTRTCVQVLLALGSSSRLFVNDYEFSLIYKEVQETSALVKSLQEAGARAFQNLSVSSTVFDFTAPASFLLKMQNN